ncbi:MAG: DUF748 domain-containing protein [Pseudomonadota bacterium]
MAIPPRRSRLHRALRWSAFSIAGFLTLALAAWLGLPPLTKHIVLQQIEAQTGRTAAIGEIRFNPFTLTLTVADFTLYETDKTTPALSARNLLLNASVTSLFRLAPVLDEVRLGGPMLHIVRTGAEGGGRFNFSDVLERILAKPASDKPLQFSVANIQLDDGVIRFDDKVTGKRVDVAAFKLGLPFISNFPKSIDAFVQPNLSARINGTPFVLQGRSKPFAGSMETSLAIDIDKLDLARYAAFSPLALPLKIDSATMSTRLDLDFMRNQARPEVTLSGTVTFDDIALSDMKSAPLFKARTLEARIRKLNVLSGDAAIDLVRLQAPQMWAALDADGIINWAALSSARAPAVPVQSAEARKANRTPQVSLAQFSMQDGTLNWLDAANATPTLAVQLKNVSAHASQLSLDESAKPATVSISAGIDGAQKIHFIGQANPALAILAGQAGISGMSLAQYQPYLNRSLAAGLGGNLSLSTLVLVESGQVQLHRLGVVIDDLKLAARSKADGSIVAKKLTLENASVHTGKRRFSAAGLQLAGLQGEINRDREGKLNLQRYLVPPDAPAKAAVAAAPPWLAKVERVAISDSALTFADNAVSPAVRIKTSGLSLRAENVSSNFDRPIKVALQTRLEKNGSLRVDGNVASQMRSLDLNIDGRNLPLVVLQPYFTQALNVHLASGQATAKGKLALVLPTAKKPMSTRFGGMLQLANFRVVNKESAADFLRWKSLDVTGIDAEIGGPRQSVSVAKVELSEFRARAVLSAAGDLNLQEVLAQDEPAPDTKTTTVTSAGTTTAASLPPTTPAENAPVIKVGQIVIKGGNINFTDNFVQPNYTVNMTGMTGTVGAIASNLPQPAAIDLRGKIDNDAPVTISGSLNPLFKPMFLDIKASANGVDLPRLTPYAAKYAGYPIEKGKLSMDINYRIEDQKLTAENSLRIEQLTFGDKVDSPTATKLPVLLALSLLKDRNGRIDINLPISGSLSDPQFSIGGLVMRMFMNLIVKAVTSPFALIASAFGGSGEELGYAEFASGSPALTPASQAKLDTLAKALIERPGLKLDITGRADPQTDTDGARLQSLNRRMRMLKLKDSLGQGKEIEPEDVSLSDAERLQYLEKLYKGEKFDKPRNAIGMAKSLPPEEMQQLILQNTVITTDDLRRLASRRATAVRRYLETKGEIPLERMFLIAPKVGAEGGKGSGDGGRVDFALK